jgi:AraC-like DNA-binding protein
MELDVAGSGYYPVQLPFLLNERFKQNVLYAEAVYPDCSEFAICFWEMEPKVSPNQTVENIILPDACIDLLVDAGERVVGFTGMKETEFHLPIPAGTSSFGFRLRPGAFHCLTGESAELAMDGFVALEALDHSFSTASFFELSVNEQKKALKERLLSLGEAKKPSDFMDLFDTLFKVPPSTVKVICESLGYSQKQCERLFRKHFGLTPKVVLSILRFQNTLRTLTSDKAKQGDILHIEGYYDQPHLNRDIKQTLGLTPLELIKACRKDDDFIQ